MDGGGFKVLGIRHAMTIHLDPIADVRCAARGLETEMKIQQ